MTHFMQHRTKYLVALNVNYDITFHILNTIKQHLQLNVPG